MQHSCNALMEYAWSSALLAGFVTHRSLPCLYLLGSLLGFFSPSYLCPCFDFDLGLPPYLRLRRAFVSHGLRYGQQVT